MSFRHPSLLWLLLLPAALLLATALRRARSEPLPFPKIPRGRMGRDHSSLVVGPWTFSPRPVAASLALAALILTIARPQGDTITTHTVTESRDVLVAVDVSRSMLADDVSPDRLSRARLLVRTLTDELQGERLGLLPFAGTAFLQSPLSADYEIFRTFLDELGPEMIPAGGSDFTALLTTAAEAFGAADADSATAAEATVPSADRFLIILSDGEAQDDTWRPMAQKLADRGVRILSLGLGTASGAMIPDGKGGLVKDARGAAVLSRLDASTLQALAESSEGAYRDASTWVDLPALLRETVARGRTQREITETAPRREELFTWFLVPGLALLAIALVREFPVSPRPTPPRRAAPPKLPTRYAPALAVLATLLPALGPTPEARATEAETPPPPPDPLVELVGQLASDDSLAPNALARLAELTATQAEAARSAPTKEATPFPKGALLDALDAVDQGSASAPTAADWPSLRQRLETLLAPPPEPPPSDQKQKSDGQKNQKKSDDQKSSDSDSSDSPDSSDSSCSDSNSDPSSDSPSSPNSEDAGAKDSDSPRQDSDSAQSDPKSDEAPGADESPARPPSDQALGQLGDPPSEDASSPPESAKDSPTDDSASGSEQDTAPDTPTQLAGGVSTADPTNGDPASAADLNPALAVPQQRLDRVRDADAPARLFQLLQDAETPPDGPARAPGAPTRDW